MGTPGKRRRMYDRILVPTDGSDGVEAVLDEAIELAELTGATLHGLYVVDARDYSTLPEAKWLSIAEELESAGERALETVTERAEAAGVDVETTIERGVPHEQILEVASANGADLVAMGTHGRSGLNRFLLGSVTEKVVRGADVPVLVVRIQEQD
jgi:nucleotide-binding universal stress UspA family protein